MLWSKFLSWLLALASASAFCATPPAPRTHNNGNGVRMTAAVTSPAVTSTSDELSLAKQRAIIVGGGPAGALMALYLSQQGRGFEVDLFEKEKEDRISGPTVRSWNIVVFGRGSHALEAGGFDIQKEVGDHHVTMTGSIRHHVKKKTNTFFRGSSSVCRGDFAKALLNKASKTPNINVHYDSTFSSMDTEKRIATFERGDGKIVESAYDMLVGADGSNSRVRKTLEETVPDFTVRQRKDFMAFKTILIPILNMEGADESWTSRFHVTNSKIGCLLGPPRSDGMLTGVVILPTEGKTSFGALMKTTQDVRDFFSKHYPKAFGSEGPSDEIANDFLERTPQHLRTTYCSSLAHKHTVLIGDAAHSMWASLGQGVNSALEDCQILAEVLDSEAEGEGVARAVDIPKVLEAYSDRRLEDAQAACTLSEIGMGGGRSMRPAFMAQMLLTVILNKTLGRLAPKVFQPPALMSMGEKDVTYGMILQGVKRQAAVTNVLIFAGVTVAMARLAMKVAKTTKVI